jgi:putative transposase
VKTVRDELPDLKDGIWPELNTVYSTILQHAVEQIETNITNLGKLRDQGYDVGELKWKGPTEFRSFTYRQRGFELDEKSGPAGRGTLELRKVCGETLHVPIRLHRDVPEGTEIKHVTIKKAKTGAWYACLNIDQEPLDNPDPDEITPDETVGLDLGIMSFVHDSDGRSVHRLDLEHDRERLGREQRSLSRKEHRSNNWERQRRRVAEINKRMSDKKRDFKHKLAVFYTRQYDAVFVEDLDVKPMMEGNRNARNTSEVGWRDFITILKHHGRKRGCHVIEVEPAGTTKQCSNCGRATEKPLWVREHSCPSCGFTANRDYNAALNIKERGLDKLGVGHSELTSSESPCDSDVRTRASLSSTPVETGTAVDRTASQSVSARAVVEPGSPALKESAVSG